MIGMIICGGCLLLIGGMVSGMAGAGLCVMGVLLLVCAFTRDTYKE